MRIELVFQGFPGKLARGYMGWSSVVYIEAAGKKIVFDTGGPVKRCDLRARLQELGTSAADIDILVVSHFHDDMSTVSITFRRRKSCCTPGNRRGY